jgi:uncharacterized membrane protein YgcG
MFEWTLLALALLCVPLLFFLDGIFWKSHRPTENASGESGAGATFYSGSSFDASGGDCGGGGGD